MSFSRILLGPFCASFGAFFNPIEWPPCRRDAFNRRKWNWVWSEQETDFSYWAETEPNYEGKCLSVFWRQSNRKWVANKCSYEFGAICELEIKP